MRARTIGLFLLIGYGAFVGWSVRYLGLDTRAADAVRAGVTDFIAYAKSIPPALPEGYRVREVTNSKVT
jgi:hypothetical protein